jgi:hypothetical protein
MPERDSGLLTGGTLVGAICNLDSDEVGCLLGMPVEYAAHLAHRPSLC